MINRLPRLDYFIGGSKANKKPEGHSGRVVSVPRAFLFPGCPRGEKKEVGKWHKKQSHLPHQVPRR